MEKIKVLILPKFVLGEEASEKTGEMKLYYEKFFEGAKTLEVRGNAYPLFVKDKMAMCLSGMGKVSSALTLSAVLSDPRLDFSDSYILSTGCGGGACGYATMGDVVIASAVVDLDIGHTADIRDMEDKEKTATWFVDESFSNLGFTIMDKSLVDRVYEITKDIALDTTDRTMDILSKEFPGQKWAQRRPAVIKGTSVTSDNYWKGEYYHANAVKAVTEYGCPDPYAVSQMEDAAIAAAAKRFGMLGRTICIRDIVNTDVFLFGDTPEKLWSTSFYESIAAEESSEFLDIFEVARENNFKVGSAIAEALM